MCWEHYCVKQITDLKALSKEIRDEDRWTCIHVGNNTWLLRSTKNINQIKSNQIKFFISINNDDNNRYSTYKGNIVMCIIIHLHTFKYIYTHTYY